MKVIVPDEALERHVVASPQIVTAEIVTQIIKYEKENQLGYFSALDFYVTNNVLESDLVDALNNISWVVTNMVRNEIRTRLRPVFSNIKFESIQILANTLPSVRVNDEHVTEKLMEHFSPGTVKVNLTATLIQKFSDKKAAESLAKNLAYQWLKGSFASVVMSGVKAIN
jgi:hypothetical protein